MLFSEKSKLIDIERKSRQNAVSKQTFEFENSRQNAENKQTFLELFVKLIIDYGCIEYLFKSYFRCA